MEDFQLEMAKEQGYVPKDCYLKGILVMLLVGEGKNPCEGCNLDRKKCMSKK